MSAAAPIKSDHTAPLWTDLPIEAAPVALVTALGRALFDEVAPVDAPAGWPFVLVTAGMVDAADDRVELPEMVVGAEPVEDEADEPLEDPPEVMLNCGDWARIAESELVDETRLIWKAVPVGQAPLGNVTVTELTWLAAPVLWFWTSVTGELVRKPAWGQSCSRRVRLHGRVRGWERTDACCLQTRGCGSNEWGRASVAGPCHRDAPG